jgi:hypothetical protein
LEDDKVFNLYQEKSKRLEKVLALLFAFALLFLFIIFLPYISILDKSHGILVRLNQTQKQISAYNKTQNSIESLDSTLHNRITEDVVNFFDNIISKYKDNLGECIQGKNAIRMIQISSPNINDSKYNNVTKAFEGPYWDVCRELGYPGKTILYIYKNYNESNGKSNAYISSPMNYKDNATLIDWRSISNLEYYRGGYYGSPFWLSINAQDKINDTFTEYDQTLKDMRRDIAASRIEDQSKLQLESSLYELQAALNKIKKDLTTTIPEDVATVFKSPG